MPHATEDEAMGDGDDMAAIQQFLGPGLGDAADDGREFDQTDKAADAVDYEDFDMSDDELPEEEEATNGTGEDDDLNGFLGQTDALGGLPLQTTAPNGYHDAKETNGDLFGESDEVNDLFGDRISSPEDERQPHAHVQPTQRPGLALPSKSGLSLPTFSGARSVPKAVAQVSQSSLSPPSFLDGQHSAISPTSATDEDDEDEDPNVILQRQLLRDAKRKLDGEEVDSGSIETDMALFYTLFPGYEEAEAPRFTELFPPRNVEYKGKVPIKPPKAAPPTKLSLELLQDQERSFKLATASNKAAQDSTYNKSFVPLRSAFAQQEDSDDELDSSTFDDHETIGGVTMQDLALICQDWDVPSIASASTDGDPTEDMVVDDIAGDWEASEQVRPIKKRKTDSAGSALPLTLRDSAISFEDPERAVAKLAKAVALDLNDPNLLIDEHAPQVKRKLKRILGDKKDAALGRDLARRYNISNDQAYDLLKENHQHKVRSTYSSMEVEHSYPAAKLQYPFYRVGLDNKNKRAFHRPHLDLKSQAGREYRFQKPKLVKRKHIKGKDIKEVFARAEDLSLGDNASLLLLEYSEEAPMMMSNFGMGNRLINYYRKRDAEDTDRPKGEIGETQVLLTNDKSPFANFGHVDHGEFVPTIQNKLYRAPVFAHKSKTADFVIGISSTYESGDRLFLRNVENLHVVGQQFPLLEVPGQHSRKVTDAAKKRLRALSYRIYTKSLTRRDKVLDNQTLMPHLPGHDMPQTRSKMREFMKYERVQNRGDGSSGVWVPQPGQPVPDAETLRGWIKPEDVCLLDSMQVGVQHLADLGISESKDADDEKDVDEGANIEQQLAPWRATKNFLNACQGKAMLKLHGEGDPTSRGEAFSFVKTSMKGGFQAQGESVEDKLDARRRKENGGHSYNVAKQQKSYDDSIRRIWDMQKNSLSNGQALSDDEMDDETDGNGEYANARGNTPRSSFSTPAAFAGRGLEENASEYSGHSAGRGEKTLTIRRQGGVDANGRQRDPVFETITDPRVIKRYRQAMVAKEFKNKTITEFRPTGNTEHDEFQKQQLERELARIQRNADRREARERLKSRNNAAGSPSATAASPGPSEMDAATSGTNATGDGTPQKGKGRSKDGTARKCANCGQVGHIKTNRKSVTFHCIFCGEKKIERFGSDSSHGRNSKGNGGAKRGSGSGGASGGAAASSSVSFSDQTHSEFLL